jgi:hypothetical protein
MPWKAFAVDKYEAYQVALGTAGLIDVYGYIRLSWGGQKRATLSFYRDSATTVPANHAFASALGVLYFAGFRQTQFREAVDLLRNERPVFFHWNDTTNGALLATASEPVGEGETPGP